MTRIGGRQGCKGGPSIFNAGYAIVLGVSEVAMRDTGACLSLQKADVAFWFGADTEAEDIDIFDVAFVAVEAAVIVAPNVKLPDYAIDVALEVLTVAFANLDFRVSW